MRTLFADFTGNPQPSLCALFSSCEPNPSIKIDNLLREMSAKFCGNHPNGIERFRLAEALYYRILENIIRGELKLKPLDVNVFLNYESIHRCLIVCSIEIVLYAYNNEKKFPWVLEICDVHAFTFHKLIELVVRYSQELLTRDIIKHLNTVSKFITIRFKFDLYKHIYFISQIEEQCLESLIWTSGSPMWDGIKNISGLLPSHRDVARKNDDDLTGISRHSPEFNRTDNNDNNRKFFFKYIKCQPTTMKIIPFL